MGNTCRKCKRRSQKLKEKSLETKDSSKLLEGQLSSASTEEDWSIDYDRYPFLKLTWDDFEGPPDEKKNYDAYIYWDAKYRYNVDFKTGKMRIFVSSNCLINRKKSWVRKPSDQLLEHEAGHFLIGWICALEFKKKVFEADFSDDNYHEEIKSLYQATLKELLEWEKVYDEVTNHYKNRKEQIRWDGLIRQRLQPLLIYIHEKHKIKTE